MGDENTPPMITIGRPDNQEPGSMKVDLDQFKFIEVGYQGVVYRLDLARLFDALRPLREIPE